LPFQVSTFGHFTKGDELIIKKIRESLRLKWMVPDEDSFQLTMDHKRSVAKVSLFIGIPLFLAMAIKNFIRGDNIMAFSNCMELLILILLGFVIMRRIEEKSEYRIYSVLFRLFFAGMGVSLIYDIGFQSNFSRIEWCYIYPVLVFLAVGLKEGAIWVSIFYGIIAFLILNFDLQGVSLFQIQELRSRFLVSFFAVCILSLFLEQGFRRAQQRLLHHQHILKESENRYRQAYEQLNIEMQERKRADEALLNAAQQWRTTFDGISDMVCLLDPGGKILRCNKAMGSFLKKPFSEIIGRTHWEIVHGTTAPVKECPVERMWETRRRETDTLPMDDRWFSIAVDPLLDEAGCLNGAVHIMSDVTERKQTEEALRQSEEKYRTILENIEDGYYEIDLAGNFTFFNDSMCRIFGHPREELMGMNNRQYTDQENAKKLFQAVNQVYRTGEPGRGCDWEIIRKDGTKRTIEASISLRKDSSAKPIGFRGIARDITERKQTEETLRQSEERYRTIIENIQEAYFEGDLAGNLTFFNDVFCRDLGYTREELIGMNYRQYLDEENAKRSYQLFNELYRTGEPIKAFDMEVIRKDGTKAIYETSVSLIRGSKGKPMGFRRVSRDITERKRTEEALRQSEERYRTILENIQDGYFEVDLAGNFTFVNDAECANLGYSRDELIGMNDRQYINKENAKKVFQAFSELYRTGEPIKALDYEIIRKDGTNAFTEISVSLIRDSEGKPIGFRGVNRNVTERKRAEEALKRNQEELIQKNKEIDESRRNLQLALEELERAYKELKATQAQILQQEKMASIGQLAAGVAHEINNPMAFISSNLGTLDKYVHRLTGFIQTQSEVIESLKAADAIEGLKRKQKELKLDYITEDINQLITESLDGSERVQKIVQGLKSFARVDEAEYKYADINECIESTINIVWNELKYKATLKKDYGNLPLTKCYPQQMNQVFMNLLINAGHAIEKQGEITIKTWNEDGSIWVAISDTGHGIPKESLNRIFEPFFTTKEVGKGTGLGLSITYEIVQKHHGEITAESEVGKGTTFTVRIPIV
jgi:PAS domain S-box-containing protein